MQEVEDDMREKAPQCVRKKVVKRETVGNKIRRKRREEKKKGKAEI